jgi:hypothetical protein
MRQRVIVTREEPREVLRKDLRRSSGGIPERCYRVMCFRRGGRVTRRGGAVQRIQHGSPGAAGGRRDADTPLDGLESRRLVG